MRQLAAGHFPPSLSGILKRLHNSSCRRNCYAGHGFIDTIPLEKIHLCAGPELTIMLVPVPFQQLPERLGLKAQHLQELLDTESVQFGMGLLWCPQGVSNNTANNFAFNPELSRSFSLIVLWPDSNTAGGYFFYLPIWQEYFSACFVSEVD